MTPSNPSRKAKNQKANGDWSRLTLDPPFNPMTPEHTDHARKQRKPMDTAKRTMSEVIGVHQTGVPAVGVADTRQGTASLFPRSEGGKQEAVGKQSLGTR
jgi:hypothetical protein